MKILSSNGLNIEAYSTHIFQWFRCICWTIETFSKFNVEVCSTPIFRSFWQDTCHINSSALVCQTGEKVNYPTRPVDTSTDFEGTTSLQPPQTVFECTCHLCLCSGWYLLTHSLIRWHRYPLEMQFLGPCLVLMEGQWDLSLGRWQ